MQSGFSDNLDKAPPMSHPASALIILPLKQFLIYILHAHTVSEFVFSYIIYFLNARYTGGCVLLLSLMLCNRNAQNQLAVFIVKNTHEKHEANNFSNAYTKKKYIKIVCVCCICLNDAHNNFFLFVKGPTNCYGK